jgi:hypothetical protein
LVHAADTPGERVVGIGEGADRLPLEGIGHVGDQVAVRLEGAQSCEAGRVRPAGQEVGAGEVSVIPGGRWQVGGGSGDGAEAAIGRVAVGDGLDRGDRIDRVDEGVPGGAAQGVVLARDRAEWADFRRKLEGIVVGEAPGAGGIRNGLLATEAVEGEGDGGGAVGVADGGQGAAAGGVRIR